jgi:hypothetical protein
MQQWHNSKNFPFGVNTTIDLKEMTTGSDNNGIQRGVLQLTSVPVFSDVVVKFLSSFLVLTLNGQFWGCAATEFSKRCILKTEWRQHYIPWKHGLFQACNCKYPV